MNRRDFLRLSAGAMALGTSWRLWAAPTGGSGTRFVMIFLRGGYDALSVLVPYAEPFYYEARPHIALAKPDGGNPHAALKLDGRWALHPALEEGLLPFYQEKQLAFVPFAGTGFVSRSHFQAQDWIEFGQPPGPSPDGRSGFLNRLLAELGGGQEGVSFTATLPPVMRGPVLVGNSPITLPKGRPSPPNYEALVRAMYTGHPLEEVVRDGLGLRHEIASELAKEMQAASREALPAGGFALEATRIGRLLRERPEYSIGFVDVGGWDTHAGQGGALGPLSNQLSGLGEGLKGLADALGPEWNKTVVVVMSEFGRTFRENGSRGTDHGHGTAFWVLGGGVRGGAIRGEQAGLSSPRELHEERDLPVLNEYRAILGGLFGRAFGLDTSALRRVFPGSSPLELGLL